ncbi:MAG: thioredoxin [Coprococcus catus]|mgnify:FL=1|uniref:Thioredoxin n=1 Tax=Coprococcus intestinihominis TaxID=3133154 RepID=A0ABV1B6E7_9FIRM|nr:thioredoxin [Coprococcus catus]MDD6343439.1 thioredoxin [Coprococcus catus]MDY5989215.1 thioredoxin [Coprococcus catus]
MAIIDLTKENFQAEVTKSDKPVLVDFWAVWCGPCQMMAPILHELETEMPDVQIGKVNVDEQMDLARQFRVVSIPTLIIFKNGQEVQRMVGVTSKEELKDALK